MAILSGTVTTTPGTPIALGGLTRYAWVIIQWKTGNTGNLYVGGTTTTKPLSANCPATTAGNSVTLPFAGAPGAYALNNILLDSDNAGVALWTAGRP